MRLFKKKKFWLVIIILVIGIVWFVRSRSTATTEVKTATVERKDIQSELVISGKVDAMQKASMNFQSPGRVAFVRVKNGDFIKKGDLLTGLDLGDLQTAERAAYYSYLAADANAKEVEDAVKGHSGDESFVQKNDRVAAQTARDKAYDSWLSAKRAVGYATLRSPLEGVVTDITVTTVGDTVSVTDGVTVVAPETIYFATTVNETDIAKVYVGQSATITVDAYPDETFTGVISRMGYATEIGDTGATVLPIFIDLPPTAAEKMKLGLNGDARLVLAEAKDVLVLPQEAVIEGKVTLQDGTEKEVKTGIESDFDIQITEGLNEGDVVLIK